MVIVDDIVIWLQVVSSARQRIMHTVLGSPTHHWQLLSDCSITAAWLRNEWFDMVTSARLLARQSITVMVVMRELYGWDIGRTVGSGVGILAVYMSVIMSTEH
mgnify:FL=1